MERYGYIRVSTKEQNPERQFLAMEEQKVKQSNIYLDKMSGQDFSRPQYLQLLKRLKKGDLLIVKSIDRLGRNYAEILEQWRKITKEIGADIQVIDMPLLNTNSCHADLTGVFISDLVLQILAWNITENQPVMKLFTGTVEMAIRSGVEIIPVAMENRGNTYYVNIGKNMDCSNVPLDKKREKTDELRDILCTLKWELWEREGVHKRSDIPNGYADTFLNNIMSQTTPDYTVDEIIRTRFHSKEADFEEAFAFMDNLIPKWENAFLFRR